MQRTICIWASQEGRGDVTFHRFHLAAETGEPRHLSRRLYKSSDLRVSHGGILGYNIPSFDLLGEFSCHKSQDFRPIRLPESATPVLLVLPAPHGVELRHSQGANEELIVWVLANKQIESTGLWRQCHTVWCSSF
jgi:hypothetical protein